jgi:signal transduction histidine kinase
MLQGVALSSALDTIQRNMQEITSLTNDILFLQEMDLILPEFRPTDIGSVVTSVVEQLRSRAEQNKVNLQLSIGPNLPQVPADAKSLSRAFLAVLDNAIKFSPDGGVVRVEVSASGTEMQIIFRDQGVGIPPDALPHIFDRFYHVEKIGPHLFRGMGLGLSIARQVIEQHHGTITAESRLDEGSTFSITIQL